MKIQDIGFLVIFLILITLRKDRWFVYAGLASLMLAIPLFAKWVFFTAERLTWFAAAYFLAAIVLTMIPKRRVV
jgi:hypothetical protein